MSPVGRWVTCVAFFDVRAVLAVLEHGQVVVAHLFGVIDGAFEDVWIQVPRRKEPRAQADDERRLMERTSHACRAGQRRCCQWDVGRSRQTPQPKSMWPLL